jgi:hypothetical protein
MDEQKRTHMDVSLQLIQWNDDFLLNIMTGDEAGSTLLTPKQNDRTWSGICCTSKEEPYPWLKNDDSFLGC